MTMILMMMMIPLLHADNDGIEYKVYTKKCMNRSTMMAMIMSPLEVIAYG